VDDACCVCIAAIAFLIVEASCPILLVTSPIGVVLVLQLEAGSGPVELAVSSSSSTATASQKSPKSPAQSVTVKEATLRALENLYDDEYDDSYDGIAVASGPKDLRMVDELEDDVKPAAATDAIDSHESDLIQHVISDPSLFDRSAESRRSAKRTQLREATGMSNEQIEGWYVMFQRNPRKDRLLEKHTWDGRQNIIPRAGAEAQYSQSDDEDEAGSANGNAGNAGNTGNTGQQSNPQRQRGDRTAQNQAYKEKHKNRFANHNRKQGHDKKFMRSVQGSQ